MLVPLSWLKEFVDIDETANEIAQRLTMSGSNVEGIVHWGDEISGVVIGQIQSIEEHPNADKLVVTKVDLGSGVVQIVTGATNIRVGDRIPVALSGARLEGGLKIRDTKLRGEKSQGMLCSAQELGFDHHGLPEDMQRGILILPEDAPVGDDFKDHVPLEDVVIDFEITPNRPDCLSILGIARETAATFNLKIDRPPIVVEEKALSKTENMVKVTIEAEDLCSRYIARVIEDIVIEPSPLWMQRRLHTAGIRSINNIVDITNFVMLELGQPLHAFDYGEVIGEEIIVRRANGGEEIATLDGVSRMLSEDMLIIADRKRPVAIAGVMGGANSEITSSTNKMLLESANFHGPTVRSTSRKLGLRSEASMRFEKGIDSQLCKIAVDRACELIEDLGAGKVARGCVDVYPGKRETEGVYFNPEKINRILGTDIECDEMVEMLRRLEIDVQVQGNKYVARAPSFRADIISEADLAEEVGRLYGYNNLSSTLPRGDTTVGGLSEHQKTQDVIKELLSTIGFSEIYTYSFVSPKVFDKIGAPEDSFLRRAVTLLNPLGEDHSIMRTTLIPNLLEVIKYNLNQKAEKIQIFEIGAVYIPEGLPLKRLPREPKKLGLGLCGGDQDFYVLKTTLETLFRRLRIDDYEFKRAQNFAFHPGRCAKVFLNKVELGYIGEVHPDTTENYDIRERVYIAELNVDILLERAFSPIEFAILPKYPSSHRDLAMVVGEGVLAGDIISEIRNTGGIILEDVELFDIYKGGQIASGYKSLAFSLTYRSDAGTLTDERVNELHHKIRERLVERFDASLRE